jgi:hypothetical protein
METLETLASNFTPKVDGNAAPTAQQPALGQRPYEAAVEQINHAGIGTCKDGAEECIALRSQWDRYITSLAPHFALKMDEIDPTLAKLRQ